MLDTHRQCLTPVSTGNTNPVTLISSRLFILGVRYRCYIWVLIYKTICDCTNRTILHCKSQTSRIGYDDVERIKGKLFTYLDNHHLVHLLLNI